MTHPIIQDLNNRLDSYLSDTFISPEDMHDLVRHYQISGIYHYSFYNCVLIKLQGGSFCQSFLNWQKLDRQVKRGEKAHIAIAIPFFRKVSAIQDTDLEDERPTYEKLCGFGYKKVFDISQTDGKSLAFEHNSIEDHSFSYEKLKDLMMELTGKVIREDFTGYSRGYVNSTEIVISSMSNNIDSIKTLIHEVAHYLLGHVTDHRKVYSAQEVEAEAVSGLVLSYLGINFTLTQAYIQNWKDQSVTEEVEKYKILLIAGKIIQAIAGIGGRHV